jgi:hypothetical protein
MKTARKFPGGKFSSRNRSFFAVLAAAIISAIATDHFAG